jgi:hypothetical protein
MRSNRTNTALSAAGARSFDRPIDWLRVPIMGGGYSSQTITKPYQGLPAID